MANFFSKKRIEFHILQSFPVTCLNRDDVGAPKTAMVGGVVRARVSSQCWKRQVRMALHESGVTLAYRTKHVYELLRKECLVAGANEQQAEESAKKISDTLASDTLLFLSEKEISALAAYAKEQNYALADANADGDSSEGKDKDEDENKKSKKASKPKKSKQNKKLAGDIAKILKKNCIKAADGLDIALFGRMVANITDINVEAAASFSHAITTHKVSPEIDFFTAIDDVEEESASSEASHMGSLQVSSGTFYRYVCLDLGQLAQTFAVEDEQELKEDMKTAIEAFIKALYVAVPSARQHTQTGMCGWDYARVLVRSGQPLQCSFEKPVRADLKDGGGYLAPSIDVLDKFIDTRRRMSGSLYQLKADYKLSAEEGSVDGLIDAIEKAVL